MIDLLFYLRCDYRIVSSLFQMFFFDLVREDVSAGPGETCGKWSDGRAIFGFGGLTCAGRFVLVLDDLVKGVPKVCDGFVFCGH